MLNPQLGCLWSLSLLSRVAPTLTALSRPPLPEAEDCGEGGGSKAEAADKLVTAVPDAKRRTGFQTAAPCETLCGGDLNFTVTNACGTTLRAF
jgi:hypothetical protein